MSMIVRGFNPLDAPDDELSAVHDLYAALEAEDFPSDPPMPLEMRLASWRHVEAYRSTQRWVGWEESRAVALAGVVLEHEHNLANAYGWTWVRPEHRRRGWVRAIAAPMLDYLTEHDRRSLAIDVTPGGPGAELAERVGMPSVYAEKISRLTLADVDTDLMQRWIDRASERASDYELLSFSRRVPDDLLEPYCQLMGVMNTAPLEDLDWEDEVFTPTMLRDGERRLEEQSREILVVVARHVPTGQLAGYTTLIYQHLFPAKAWQGDTGVDPDHRNKGLGRWLKAKMILEFLDAFPDARFVDTYNAGSNEPMLNINVAMGFTPVLLQETHQGDVATIRARLGI